MDALVKEHQAILANHYHIENAFSVYVFTQEETNLLVTPFILVPVNNNSNDNGQQFNVVTDSRQPTDGLNTPMV